MSDFSATPHYRPSRQPVAVASKRHNGRLRVILGPTNTGKTHLAVERMLAHSSGMIGLPLRLLAREVYDWLVRVKGKALVALITGEERIQPPSAAYFVCTVEAMPLERDVAFLAVDEIQLAENPERGHVFTDRLLRARGREETIFMGAASMRPLLQRLLPDAQFETRTRLSQLSYGGAYKLSRLPRRAALVAFSANEVYALAELLRRQKGGAAVVMGALSPRTRNAQVDLFENGEVDYLVATDAIGMGLNLNITHVAFGGLAKFDGARHRPLTAAEIGQIAGRAGRHMTDGTFGTLAEAGQLPPELIDAVEDHRFPDIKAVQWRSSNVDYSSIEDLISSLEVVPATDGLVPARETDDIAVLKRLALDPAIRRLAAGPAAVGLLWQVCRLPDFAKVLPDIHARLVGRIYAHLMDHDGLLPEDWLHSQIAPLNNAQGDIDTLATRLAHIRTWTYVAHRGGWLSDPDHWQALTRDIEDRLSDALHDRLTQRFVDRRSTALLRGLKAGGPLLSGVDRAGAVTVEGEYVGELKGLRFVADTAVSGDRAVVMRAAREALRSEMPRRVRALAEAPDDAFTLDPATGDIAFEGHVIAELASGASWAEPEIRLKRNDIVEAAHKARVETRLRAWLQDLSERRLAPLAPLRAVADGRETASGPVRAIVHGLLEGGGLTARRTVAAACRDLAPADRRQLKRLGVRLGKFDVFLPAMQKPAPLEFGHLLWSVSAGRPPGGALAASRMSAPADVDTGDTDYAWMGYRRLGDWVIRVDVLDRFLTYLARAEKAGFIASDTVLPSLLGLRKTALAEVMQALGYRAAERQVTGYERAPRTVHRPAEKRRQPADRPLAASPVLQALKAEKRGEARAARKPRKRKKAGDGKT